MSNSKFNTRIAYAVLWFTAAFAFLTFFIAASHAQETDTNVQRCLGQQTKPAWETRCYNGNVTLENYDSLESIKSRIGSTLAWSVIQDISGFQNASASGQLYSGEQILATTLFMFFGGHLGWAHDVAPLTEDIRQTGPVFAEKGFDTHQRVRLFYSDGVVDWLKRGRTGDIRDGEMIVKQMYASNPEESSYGADRASGWAVMIRNSNLSKDGWLWYLFFFPNSPPYNAPAPVFYGQTGDNFCLSCHAAVDNKEMTFSSISNLQGARQAYSFSNLVDPGVFVAAPKKETSTASKSKTDEAIDNTTGKSASEASVDAFLSAGISQFQKLGFADKDSLTLVKKQDGPSHLERFEKALSVIKAYSDDDKEQYVRKLLKDKLRMSEDKILAALGSGKKSGTINNFYVSLLEEFIDDIEQVLGNETVGEFADQLVELVLRTVMQVQSETPLNSPNPEILKAFAKDAKATLPKNIGDLKWFPLDFIFSHTPVLPEKLPKEVCEFHENLETNVKSASFFDDLKKNLEAYIGETEDCRDVFVTSDNCNGCHWSYVLQGQIMPHMLTPTDKDDTRSSTGTKSPSSTAGLPTFWDISPYAEWSASMMGLAGKDPIFHAQLSWEQEHNGDAFTDRISNLCLRCHQPAAQRQFHLDHGDKENSATVFPPPQKPDRPRFTNAYSKLAPSSTISNQTKWGALGRDGVTCTICHQIEADGLGTPETFTSQFKFADKPGKVFGPFASDEVKPFLMEQALGITPVHGPQIQESSLCGSCHTVITPIVSDPLTEDSRFRTTYEQTTYVEWLNSKYASDGTAETCQDCHMPSRLPDQPGGPAQGLTETIANVETAYLPMLDTRAADTLITPTPKKNFKRHTLAGMNLFANQMFQQFPGPLGNSGRNAGGIPTALPPLVLNQKEMVRQGTEETIDVSVTKSANPANGKASFDVNVVNKVGHKFPSGVGFRRAFIRFEALDEAGKLIWSSGRNNAAGQIIGPDGTVLSSEMTMDPLAIPTGNRVITDQNDVYIFEERTATWKPDEKPTTADMKSDINIDLGKMQLTTSFLEIVTEAKDTRLLPLGWKKDGPYGQHTQLSVIDRQAKKPVSFDPQTPGQRTIRYDVPLEAGKVSKIRATVLYQSIPPYYIKDRLQYDTPEIQQLYYMVAHLKTDETPIKNWAVELVSAELNVE